MRFLKLEQGEAIEDVAARLASSRSAAARERTLEALRRANPELAAETRATAGERILVIPDDVDPADSSGSSAPSARSADALITDARARLDEAARVVPEQLSRQEERATDALANLDSSEVKKLAQGRPELAKQLADVRAVADERLARLQFARKLHAEALGAMQADLEGLARLALERSSVGGAILDLDVPFTAPAPPAPAPPTGTPTKEPESGTGRPTKEPDAGTGGGIGTVPTTPTRPTAPRGDVTGGTTGGVVTRPTREPIPTTRTQPTAEEKPKARKKRAARKKKKKDE